MIIFSSQKLEQSLATGDLSPWDKTKYIIFTAIMMSLAGVPYICNPKYAERDPMLNMLASILCVIATAIMTYFGIRKCHQTNEALDKKAFFERFFVLSVPVTVKLVVFFLPLSLTALLYVHHLKDGHPLLHKRFPILLSLCGPVVTWVYYTMVDRSLKRFGCLIQDKKRYGS
jgi:hypothetical protein